MSHNICKIWIASSGGICQLTSGLCHQVNCILTCVYKRLWFQCTHFCCSGLFLIYCVSSIKTCYHVNIWLGIQIACMLPHLPGRMYLFYGNKTSVQFVTFTTTVTCPGELQSHILHIHTCQHMFIPPYTRCDKVSFFLSCRLSENAGLLIRCNTLTDPTAQRSD